MQKTVNVGKYGTVKLPDTFSPAVLETNKGGKEVNVFFGANMDVVVCIAKNKKLSGDNQERIRILVDVR